MCPSSHLNDGDGLSTKPEASCAAEATAAAAADEPALEAEPAVEAEGPEDEERCVRSRPGYAAAPRRATAGGRLLENN